MPCPQNVAQIEELYHAARERGSNALAGVDSELRAEVERLQAQDSDGKILDGPAADLLPDSIARRIELRGDSMRKNQAETELLAGRRGTNSLDSLR
jgi:hypothetical protein